MLERKRQEEDAVFLTAVRSNPTERAKAAKLAKQLNVPISSAEETVAAEQRTRAADLRKMHDENPEFGKFLSHLPTVRQLHDDLGNLQLTSRTFDWWRRNYEAGSTINEAGFLKARQALLRSNKADLSWLEKDRLAEIDRIQTMAEMEGGPFDEATKLIGQMVQPALLSLGTGTAAAGVASLGGPVSSGAAFAWGAGAAMFTHSAIVEFGHEYDAIYQQLIDAGVPADEAHDTALAAGGAYGLGAAAMETIGGTFLAKPIAAAGKRLGGRLLGLAGPSLKRASGTFVKETLVGGLTETGTEGGQELLAAAAEGIANAYRGTDNGPTLGDALKRAGEVMWKTAKGMAVIAPLGPSIHYAADAERVKKAQGTKELFTQIAKNAEESVVRERTPDLYAAMVNAKVDGSDLSHVYIEGPKLAQALDATGQSREQLMHDLPDVAKQLAAAERTGEDVAIPMGDFAAKIAASDLYPAIQKSIRIGKDGFSLDRAEEWMSEQGKNREESAKRVAEAASKVADWDAQAVRVEERIVGELQKDTRITPEKVRMYASLHRQFVETQAANDGKTPEEFDAQHRLTFTVNRPDGGRGLFQFGGMKAANADIGSLAAAQVMLENGVADAEKIRQTTGWFKGLDGKWRFEFSDDAARLKTLPGEDAGALDLGAVLDHPKLFAAYPNLAYIRVNRFKPTETRPERGRFSPNTMGLDLRGGMSDKETLSVLLHEIQHGIQAVEGFARGGSPGEFTPDELNRLTVERATRRANVIKQRFPEAIAKVEALNAANAAYDATRKNGGEQSTPASVAAAKRVNEAYNAVRQDPNADKLTDLLRIIANPESAWDLGERVRSFDAYHSIAGEVEARNVQARQELTEEERLAKPPETTQDVDPSDIIHRNREFEPFTSETTDDTGAAGSDQTDQGSVQDTGGVPGGTQPVDEPAGAKPDAPPLEGLPATVKVDGKDVAFGPSLTARYAARVYMRRAGLPYNPARVYAPVDIGRAKRIATAYEELKHAPDDPQVKAAYEALARETVAQYQAMIETGVRVEFNPPGPDPYPQPRFALLDLEHNHHLFIFSTEDGYGQAGITDQERAENPMLRDSGIKFGDRPALVNDLFRAVHDYFGHFKEGVGFRARGEENAWQQHMGMYSPLARRAATTETRGQNSWVNYGPHAQANKTASGADTVYAEQKVGLLPEWVMQEGYLGPADVVEQPRAPRITERTRAISRLLKNLTPQEQAKITDKTAAKIIEQLTMLPSANEIAAVAEAGKAKRGWYEKSARTLVSVFGVDAPRFAALLAALSPQTSVQANLANTLNVWKEWLAAGRPTDRGEIIDVMSRSVQGKSRESVLDAWINNSVRALASENLSSLTLSGPKVNSFFRNLVGDTVEVTNDAWMANFALIDQALFGGSLNVAGNEPGKSATYLAMSSRIREAAGVLTKLSGETWTPAEVQETVWSWAKTLYELQVGGVTATEALQQGQLTDDLINSTPDFSSLFAEPEYAGIIEDTYGRQLDRIREDASRSAATAAVAEPGAAGQAGAFAPEARRQFEQRAAKRLERLFKQREAASRLRQEAAGEFDPATNTIFLNPGATATTVLHEMSHFWVTTLFKMAAVPTASVGVTKDAQTLLSWFKVKDLDTWNSMTLDEQRKHHEAWAYNAEAHFFGEGKSPSVDDEQRRLFRAFGRFVRSTYRNVRDVLNTRYRRLFGEDLPGLTPEVRDVFDRMLASEDAIESAKAERAMAPMLPEKPSEMSDADWASYKQAEQDANDASIDTLQRESLRAMRWTTSNSSKLAARMQRFTKALRQKVEAEERAKVEQEPVYRAQAQLQHGVTIDDQGNQRPFKVSLQSVRDIGWIGDLTAEEVQQRLGTGPSGMLAVDGLPADFAASMFGFTSGADMLAQLVAAKPVDVVVQERANARMLAEHSNLTDPEKVKLLIEKALHNESRSKMIAAELRFLSKLTTPLRLMVRAAREHARDIIGKMAIGRVKPHEHARAEVRNRREADRAMAKNDPKAAASFKRRELIEGQLEREAIVARELIDDTQKLVSKLFRSDKKLAATRDIDYIAIARYLASAFGLAPGERTPDSYVKQLQAYNPELFERLEPQLERARQWAEQAMAEGRVVRTWRDLTTDEFRDLGESIAALWHQSIREQQIEIDGKKVMLDDVAVELAVQDSKLPPKPPEPVGAKTPGELFRRGANRLKQLIARPEHWAFRKDGAEKPGAFTRYFWRPIRDAVNRYVVDRNRYTKRIADMVKGLRPKLKQGLIEFRDPEGKLLYTFGRGNGGFGHAELVAALLHTGNEGNLMRLLVGRGWGTFDKETETLDSNSWDLFVREMITKGYITKDVMDFVQRVWDMNEEVKPLAQKAHRSLFGFYFKEIEATPLTLPWGGYRGGYMPAKLDKTAASAGRIQSLQDLETDFRKQFATTGHGFAKNRADFFAEPLLLDIDLVPSHIDDVLRFAHLQPAVRDVERVMNQKDVATMLEARQPGVRQNMLLPWLQRVASQSITRAGKNEDIDSFWRFLRSSAGLSTMFANLGNALQQLTGVFAAALKVKPRYLAKGMWRLLTERKALYEDIAGQSSFMENRQSHQVFDSLEQIHDLMQNRSKFAKTRSWVKKHGYFLQSAFQNAVDAVVWSGAHEQAIAESPRGTSDADANLEAVRQADAAVRMTQSSFDPADVAHYEEGSPFYRIWTMFSGYFNTMANLQADQLVRMGKAQGFGKLGVGFQAYLLGFAVPMLLAEAITRTVRGRWDDEDEDGDLDILTFDYLFLSQLRSAIAEIPVVGPAGIAPALNMLDNQPWNDRMTTSPAVTVLEKAFGGTVDAAKTLAGWKTDRRGNVKTVDGDHIRDVITLLGVLSGLPLGTLGSRAGYAYDVSQGTISPAGGYDTARALISGAAGAQATRKR